MASTTPVADTAIAIPAPNSRNFICPPFEMASPGFSPRTGSPP